METAKVLSETAVSEEGKSTLVAGLACRIACGTSGRRAAGASYGADAARATP
jgi:hypothetical protein